MIYTHICMDLCILIRKKKMELVEIFIETNEKETKDQTYTMHGDMFKNKKVEINVKAMKLGLKLGFTLKFFSTDITPKLTSQQQRTNGV